jgi:hypothetical protein
MPSIDQREAFINGLHALASYLDAHPDVPIPAYGTQIPVPLREAEDGGDTEVMNAANALAAHFDRTENGGCETWRTFGPVAYKVFALSKESIARYRAETTYRGCITPAEA